MGGGKAVVGWSMLPAGSLKKTQPSPAKPPEPQFLVFANFHGANIHILADVIYQGEP